MTSEVPRQLQEAEHVENDLGRRVGRADHEVGRVEQAQNVDHEAERADVLHRNQVAVGHLLAKIVNVGGSHVDQHVQNVDKPRDEVDGVVCWIEQVRIDADSNRDHQNRIEGYDYDKDFPCLFTLTMLDYTDFPAVVFLFLLHHWLLALLLLDIVKLLDETLSAEVHRLIRVELLLTAILILFFAREHVSHHITRLASRQPFLRLVLLVLLHQIVNRRFYHFLAAQILLICQRVQALVLPFIDLLSSIVDHFVPVRLCLALLVVFVEYLRVLLVDGTWVGIILYFQLRCQLFGNGGSRLGTFWLGKAILILV